MHSLGTLNEPCLELSCLAFFMNDFGLSFKGFKIALQVAHRSMVGIVTRVHIRELLEVLLLALGKGCRIEGAQHLPGVLVLLSKSIPFLASIHEDNHLFSKLLAKSYSALQEIQRVLSGSSVSHSNFQDVKYHQYSKFDPHRVMSPLKVKLRLVDQDVKIAQAQSMAHLCGCLGKVTTSRCSEGGDLLLVPVLCMMLDILPHLEKSIETDACSAR